MLSFPPRPVETGSSVVPTLLPRVKPPTSQRHSSTEAQAVGSSRPAGINAPAYIQRIDDDPQHLATASVKAQDATAAPSRLQTLWRLLVGDGEDRGDGFDDYEHFINAYAPASSQSMYHSGVADRLAMDGI